MRAAIRLVIPIVLGALIAVAVAPGVAARPVAAFPIDTAPLPVPALASLPPPAGTPATAGAFRMNLAHPNDFVAQATFVQCVGASIQMMLNIERPGADRTDATQRRLQLLARTRSGPVPDGFVRHGASIRGWAAVLELKGGGPYQIVGADNLADAMHRAAVAIRTTNRPVGLLVWRGRHAWVMSGFVATADPLTTDAFRVTRAFILDPLYAYGSATWGPSPRPGQPIPVSKVGRQLVRRLTTGPWSTLPGAELLAGKYALVLPVAPQAVAPAAPRPRLVSLPSRALP
jgi:hypothetical protein